MGIGKTLVGWLGIRLARALATRVATPLILVGTLAGAAFGAAALNPATSHDSPNMMVIPAATLDLSSRHTFCMPDSDGDGHTMCHIEASQESTIPNLGCSADPDGDGTLICYYATDPTATN